MNLRCFYCQTPFTLGRPEMLAALQRMEEENLNHYDAHCPRCRRANSISRERMEMFFPNWRQVAEEQAANPPQAMSAASSEEPTDKESEAMPEPMAPATSMEEPAMEPESMKSSAKKHTRKRAGSGKKTKPAVAKKMTAKAAKKPAKAQAKMPKKSTAKAKPAAKKKTAAKTKKK